MTIGPKKKTSKSLTRERTSAWILKMARKLKNRVMLNKESTGLAHVVDENGMYNGRQVIAKKSNKKTTRI
ncbi:50S ribosomal protein L32 [Candidatus Gracilibacteria bacterium]|nr:50S ribosomal protein L32 [Candidatus Gracilibacteria bacterium]